MRVGLHVGQLRQPVPGGIGTYVRELWSALPGIDVDITAFAAGAVANADRASITDLGWPHDALRYELWLRTRRPALPLAIDVVHGPSLAVPPRRTHHGSRPLVVTVHDVAFLRHPEFFTRRGVTFHRRGLMTAMAEADVIVTPSTFTADELVREGVGRERIRAIPHGIRLAEPPSSEHVQQVLHNYGIVGPYFVLVGTIEPRKGHGIASAALELVRRTHPDVTLVVAGPDGWNTVTGIDAPGVIRTGLVDRATLDALYAGAVGCLVPSVYEGFGLPALEAMARGCPVVASSCTSLPEVVGAAGTLIAPDDLDGWANAMGELLDDPATRNAQSTLGRERAQTFRWEQSALAHRSAYELACGPSARIS